MAASQASHLYFKPEASLAGPSGRPQVRFSSASCRVAGGSDISLGQGSSSQRWSVQCPGPITARQVLPPGTTARQVLPPGVAPYGSPSPFTEYYSEQLQGRGGSRSEFRSGSITSSVPAVMDTRLPPIRQSVGASRPLDRDQEQQARSGIEESQPSDRSCDDDDIALRLPELREVLAMLRGREGAGELGKAKGPGNVFLVGTGPGDAELLTVKALRLLQSADLVLYDRLVSTDILQLIHPEARLLYVGKTSGYHSRTQEEIHELLLAFAEAGARVVRLKGGDPLVFGRGGEEMDFLQERGIHVQIVPGITAASGIAAELGIPLTHRGVANSVRFLTGHSRKGGEDPLYVAESAADPDATLVVYMGLATLPGLAAKLLARGLPPSTPAVAVERGTTPDQRTVFAELQDLPAAVEAAELVSPTLIFIGRVVALSYLWPMKGHAAASKGSSPAGTARAERASASETETGSMAGAGEAGPREPRNRALRGADPALPSQLAAQE